METLKNIGLEKDKILRTVVKLEKEKNGWPRPIFSYSLEGRPVKSKDTIAYIESLKIPPAWNNVRISIHRNNIVRAVGLDKNDKIQYLYHPLYTEAKSREKYSRLGIFIKNRHKIDKFIESQFVKVPRDVAKDTIIALLYSILYSTSIRIGNDSYDTYGLTTLECEHVSFCTDKSSDRGYVVFNFTGKKGVEHSIEFSLPDVQISVLKRLYRLASKRADSRLFVTDKGECITSQDINTHLKEITKSCVTCKDFRTYGSNYTFVKSLLEGYSVKEAVKEVAKELGNGPGVSKKSYIIPELLELDLGKSGSVPFTGASIDRILMNVIKEYYTRAA